MHPPSVEPAKSVHSRIDLCDPPSRTPCVSRTNARMSHTLKRIKIHCTGSLIHLTIQSIYYNPFRHFFQESILFRKHCYNNVTITFLTITFLTIPSVCGSLRQGGFPHAIPRCPIRCIIYPLVYIQVLWYNPRVLNTQGTLMNGISRRTGLSRPMDPAKAAN